MWFLQVIFLFFALMAGTLPAISQEDEMVCLVYHRFGDGRYPSTNIGTDLFESQIKYLKDQNFTLLTLSQAVIKLSQDELPDKCVVITIDDGYRSFLTGGMPILEKYGVPATLFINTETVGSADYLNWEEIRTLRDQGIEIGNHSHSHAHFLNRGNEGLFADDLLVANKLFGKHLGVVPGVFSYPYGEWNLSMQDVLRDNGFLCAAAQNSGAAHKSSDLFALPRFPMNEQYGKMENFITKVNIHALPLLWVEPVQPLLSFNPPVLRLGIKSNCIIPEQINCFIDGEKSCIKKITTNNDEVILKIVTEEPLPGRRTLYTITAPLASGKGWCWYSHLWVNTNIKE